MIALNKENVQDNTPEVKVDEEAKYVVFKLEDEFYGVGIHFVQNIERVVDITRVPHSSEYVEGVMNVRGEIIPVLNMRTFLRLPLGEATEDRRVIIIRYEGMLVGLLVDESSEVLALKDSALEEVPKMQEGLSEKSIKGLGQDGNRIIIILDIEEILSSISNQNK